MTIRIPNEGEVQLLSYMLGKATIENFIVKLYTNNYTPAETDTSASYTVASGSGYADVTLTAANWTIASGAPSSAGYPQITWTFTGALASPVYGYFVVGATSGKVLWSERFTNGPYSVAQVGDAIKVTLNFTMQDSLD